MTTDLWGPHVNGGAGGRGCSWMSTPRRRTSSADPDQVWVPWEPPLAAREAVFFTSGLGCLELERNPSPAALLVWEGFVGAQPQLIKAQFHFITAQGRESYNVSPHLYSKLTKLWINPHGRKRGVGVQARIRRAACAQAPGHSALWVQRHLRSPLQLAVKEVN